MPMSISRFTRITVPFDDGIEQGVLPQRRCGSSQDEVRPGDFLTAACIHLSSGGPRASVTSARVTSVTDGTCWWLRSIFSAIARRMPKTGMDVPGRAGCLRRGNNRRRRGEVFQPDRTTGARARNRGQRDPGSGGRGTRSRCAGILPSRKVCRARARQERRGPGRSRGWGCRCPVCVCRDILPGRTDPRDRVGHWNDISVPVDDLQQRAVVLGLELHGDLVRLDHGNRFAPRDCLPWLFQPADECSFFHCHPGLGHDDPVRHLGSSGSCWSHG